MVISFQEELFKPFSFSLSKLDSILMPFLFVKLQIIIIIIQAGKGREKGALQINKMFPLWESKCFPKILQGNCRQRKNRFHSLDSKVSLWHPLSLQDKLCIDKGRSMPGNWGQESIFPSCINTSHVLQRLELLSLAHTPKKNCINL